MLVLGESFWKTSLAVRTMPSGWTQKPVPMILKGWPLRLNLPVASLPQPSPSLPSRRCLSVSSLVRQAFLMGINGVFFQTSAAAFMPSIVADIRWGCRTSSR